MYGFQKRPASARPSITTTARPKVQKHTLILRRNSSKTIRKAVRDAWQKKGGLGRGLDILFQDTGAGGGDEGVSTLRLAEIEPDKNQPRKAFDDTALSELAASITEHGVLQPIVVRPSPPAGGYIIVAGERRWRAARLAGLTEIPALIKDISDTQAMEIALIENLQREDLDPVEEALGYRQLMERCSYTQEAAAARLSKSRSAVANSLRLLNLPEKALGYLRAGKLSAGHAKAVLSLESREAQQQAADIIVKEGLNVRQAEALCKKMAKKPRPKRELTLPPPALRGGIEPERGSGY